MRPSSFEFDLGENYMLFKLKKALRESKDPLALAARVTRFIKEEEERYARKDREYYSPETVRKS